MVAALPGQGGTAPLSFVPPNVGERRKAEVQLLRIHPPRTRVNKAELGSPVCTATTPKCCETLGKPSPIRGVIETLGPGKLLNLRSIGLHHKDIAPLELNAIFLPSGDQAGYSPLTELLVRLVCPVPFAFIKKISDLDLNAILLPSGDQAGSTSPPLMLVSCFNPVPSIFIV